MIFVTVGTHEQQFNRLVEAIDKIAKESNEKYFVQTGFSDYEPQYCEWKKMCTYDEMQEKIEEARIVITHGGPSSFISPLQKCKIPIVVPRTKRYNEHVNDHQVKFCKEVSDRYENIIFVEDVSKLKGIIDNYNEIANNMKQESTSNNQYFCNEFKKIVNGLWEKKHKK